MKAILIICFSCIFLIPSFPQSGELMRLKNNFENYRSHDLQEKIYVHADRNFYVTGETMWIKVYLVDAVFHKPLNLSKVAYVEVLDGSNNSLLNGKIALQNGTGSGSFFIPASLSSGNYIIRAYTEWMKNYSVDFFFHKSVSIVNPFVKLDKPKLASKDQTITVNLFPEGGHLVKGLESRIGIQIVDSYGKGIACTGAILSANNDTLRTFRTLKFGLGSFLFTPTDGLEKLMIKKENKISFYKLPEPQMSGYVMRVEDKGNEINITVKTSGIPAGRPVFVFGHCREQIVYMHQQYADDHVAIFTLKKNLLQQGINHITVFNEQLKPVCERLVFCNPDQKLDLSLALNQKQFDTRKKVKINIQSLARGQSTSANLSVSVYKLDSLNNPATSSIYHNRWLSSDLMGKVESPEFYFSNDSLAVAAADNLMLTHGWRRFKWEDVLSGLKKITNVPEYRGHIVRAEANDVVGSPVQLAEIYLTSPGKALHIYHGVSDANGRVSFETSNFVGTSQTVIQSSDTTVKLKVLSPFLSSFTQMHLPDRFISLSADIEQPLTERSVAMQVQDIYHDKYRNRFLSQIKDTVAFYGTADETYMLDDYTRFPVMEEVMREYVAGVMVRKRRDGYHFLVLDKVIDHKTQDGPLILLDGLPLFDADYIMRYDPRLVKKIEVMTRPYLVGTKRFNGIVSFVTYHGDLRNINLPPYATILDYEGLQLQREFFTPKYDDAKQRQSRVPDQRNLLYWSPTVITNENGKIEIEFFTSDLNGTYLVQVEGQNNGGYSGSATATFTVNSYKIY